jgi:uncharacterized membrane protein HdeD (DUF308 family)
VRERFWTLPLLRAVPAAAIALAVTFTADHSPVVGYVALGSFLAASGLILLLGALRLLERGTSRNLFLAQAALMLVGGLITLGSFRAELALLLFLTSALLGASGILELVAGLLARGATSAARDWIFVGALTALFAIGVLFIPVDFSQSIVLEGKSVPDLTASVILVGAIGAYAAVIAVYLVIAGLSLKWAQQPADAAASEAS